MLKSVAKDACIRWPSPWPACRKWRAPRLFINPTNVRMGRTASGLLEQILWRDGLCPIISASASRGGVSSTF